MKDCLNIMIQNGKYTVIQHYNGELIALRYGFPWRELSGDGLVLGLAQEIERLREEAKTLRDLLKSQISGEEIVK